jgi:hypothetical protein
MFLGYFDRATNNKVKLETALIDAGLVFQKISPLDFLIGNELSDLDLMTVYEIKWKVV